MWGLVDSLWDYDFTRSGNKSKFAPFVSYFLKASSFIPRPWRRAPAYTLKFHRFIWVLAWSRTRTLWCWRLADCTWFGLRGQSVSCHRRFRITRTRPRLANLFKLLFRQRALEIARFPTVTLLCIYNLLNWKKSGYSF